MGKSQASLGAEKVQDILCGRHMADLFHTQVHKTRQGLPRLQFHFRKAAYEKLCSTLLARPFCSPIMATIGRTKRLCWLPCAASCGRRLSPLKESSVLKLSTNLSLDRPEITSTCLLLCPGADDSQSAAPQLTQAGSWSACANDEAAHQYSEVTGSIPAARQQPMPNRASR